MGGELSDLVQALVLEIVRAASTKPEADEPAILTTRQVAALLGVSTQYVREAIATGLLAAQRYGRVYRVERVALLQFRNCHKVGLTFPGEGYTSPPNGEDQPAPQGSSRSRLARRER